MAISKVQGEIKRTAAANTVTTPFTNTPTPGNLLIAWARYNNIGPGIATISGFELALEFKYGSTTGQCALFWKRAGASESKDVVLVATGATATALSIEEWTGIPNAVVDKTASTPNPGGGVTSCSSNTTANTQAANELAFTICGTGDVVQTPSWNQSFTLEVANPATNSYLLGASKVLSATGAIQSTASWATSRIAGAGIVTFMSAYSLSVDVGSYELTGVDTALKVGRKLSVDVGSYAITGTDAALSKSANLNHYTLSCDVGSYSLTGVNPTLSRTLTYFVANAGNDANDGLSLGQAWKTLNKISASTFQPNDIIKLKDDDVWYEQLTIPCAGALNKRIKLTNTGTGTNLPIISGASSGTPTVPIRDTGIYENNAYGYWEVSNVEFAYTTVNGIAFDKWTGGGLEVDTPGWWVHHILLTKCSLQMWGAGLIVEDIEGAGPPPTATGEDGAIFIRGACNTNIIVRRNKIHDYFGRGIWIMRGADAPTVEDNEVYNITYTPGTSSEGYGIDFDGYGVAITGHITCTGNHVHDCDMSGIYMENCSEGTDISDNLIHDTTYAVWYQNYAAYGSRPDDRGFNVGGIVSNNLIYDVTNALYLLGVKGVAFWNNIVQGTVTNGVLIGSTNHDYVGNLDIRNNIFGDSVTYVLRTSHAWETVCDYFDYNRVKTGNIVIETAVTDYLTLAEVQADGGMTHGFTTDPAFVDAANHNYHLQATSPCIETGINVGLTYDYDGVAIADPPEIGAFQYGLTAYTLSADSGSYSLSGVNPDIKTGRKLSVDIGSYAVSGVNPTLKVGRKLSVDVGEYSLTGVDATLIRIGSYTLSVDVGEFALTGIDANTLLGRKLSADIGEYSLTGVNPSIKVGRKLSIDIGEYILTGTDIAFAYGGLTNYSLSVDVGQFTLTGVDINALVGRKLSANVGAYNITGVDPALKTGRRLSLDIGSYAITGVNPTLRNNRVLSADVGQYSITGISVSMPRRYAMTGEPGAYVITGVDVSLLLHIINHYSLLVDPGNYLTAGRDASLLCARILHVNAGSYLVIAPDISFSLGRGYFLSAESGGYVITGTDVGLLHYYLKLFLPQHKFVPHGVHTDEREERVHASRNRPGNVHTN